MVPILNKTASRRTPMSTQGTTGFSRVLHRFRFCLHGVITRLRLEKKKNVLKNLYIVLYIIDNFLNEFGVLYYRPLKIVVRVIH